MNFDATFPLQFYINLSRRDDRRRTALNSFLDAGLERVERFPAIDSRTVGDARGHRSKGRYALSLTQKLCLREAQRRRAPAVMIFEDDVVLHPEFQERIAALELPEDWGMFYLGVQHTSEPEWVKPGLVRVNHGLDTHAVAVRAEYYRQVMKVLSPQGKGQTKDVKPSDWLLAALHQEIPTYAAFPNLAWQGQEALSDLTHSKNGAYDVRGFQARVTHFHEPVLRQHLGLRHWKEAVTHPPQLENADGSPELELNKIAFLFLTRGLPLHEEMWTEYFEGHEAYFSICTHAKEEVSEAPCWWKNGSRAEAVETKWGGISLVRAYRNQLETAMADPANKVFVLVSESCVPIKPFTSLWRHFERTGWRGQIETQSVETMEGKDPGKAAWLYQVKDIPPSRWRFHPQWIVLNREMAEAFLDSDLTPQWEDTFGADETLPGTQLALMGYPLAERTLPVASTWMRWRANHVGHPDSIAGVDEALLGELLGSPCFFARKFTRESNVRKFGLHLEGPVQWKASPARPEAEEIEETGAAPDEVDGAGLYD